ncbi:MAG: hypothetical protein P8N09_04935 [Planctomycetota bacterium]|nr:hypothetical protein [Planctomycetota bacterium]
MTVQQDVHWADQPAFHRQDPPTRSAYKMSLMSDLLLRGLAIQAKRLVLPASAVAMDGGSAGCWGWLRQAFLTSRTSR